MSKKKKGKNIAIRMEGPSLEAKRKLDRKHTVRSLTKQICNENDEGLRRLFKN